MRSCLKLKLSGRMFNQFSFIGALNRDARILMLTRAFRSFSAAIITVIFSIYLSKLGASSVTLGIVFTAMSLFAAIRSYFEGIIADRFGRKPILLYSAGLMIAGGVVYTLTSQLNVLIATSVLVGIGSYLPYTPAEQAMLTENVSDEDRTMAFSVNSFLGTLAGVFGSLAAWLPELFQSWGFSELISYRPVFTIFAVAGAVSFIFFMMIEETVGKNSHSDEVKVVEEMDADERKLLMKWSVVLALDMVGGAFIMNFVPYWFYLKFGVGPGAIGTFFGASRILAAFSYYLGFRLATRFGAIRAIVMSRVPVSIINVLTPILPGYTLVASLRGFMSLFAMIDVPLRQSYLMGVIKSNRRASAVGFVTVVGRFTAAGAPVLTGYLFQYLSTSLPFYISGFFQFLSCSLMYMLFKDIRPPEEQR